MPNRTAADIMTKRVVTLSPDDDIYAAMRVLLKKKISGAPVVHEAGAVVGVLSEKDCLKVLTAVAYDGVPGGKVSNYMTGKVDAVAPSTSVYDLITRFVQTHYRRLPVTDSDGRLLGQVSRRDVLAVIESMEDNSFLYGTEDHHLTTDTDESLGVDSATLL